MGKDKIESRDGFGPLGLLFLAVVLYVIVSISIGMATRDDKHCAPGYTREWRYAPPGWVCD
jgi:hypothetical protein